MSTAQVQKIDATAPGEHLSVVEVHTPGGIVRVNANLVNVRTGQPCVVVEVEPNTRYQPKTSGGGDWDIDVRDVGIRTDVTLTKREAQ